MDVRVLKLMSGEELVGEVIATDMISKNVTMKYPLVCLPTQDGQMVFMPFCGTADTDSVVIRNTSLICDPLPAQEEIAIQYERMVTPKEQPSNIYVPSGKIIS